MSDNQDSKVEMRLEQRQLDALIKLHARYLSGRLGGRKAVLRNVDISGLSLYGEDMRQVDFNTCIMREMDLTSANFQEAKLYSCDLSKSVLVNTSFFRCDLRGSTLEEGNLTGANFDSADMRELAVMSTDKYVPPQKVNFRGANLTGCRMTGALATKADFTDAILARSNMFRADLKNACLQGADLSGAKIKGADLHGADLKSAILTGINSDDLAATGANSSDAITDDNIGKSIVDIDKPFEEMIKTHIAWVGSAGKDGEQLDLSGYDLRSLQTLKGQKLTALVAKGARFIGMNRYQVELQSARLDNSDFRRAKLDEGDFRGTSLKGCILNHASVKNANFNPLLFGAEGPNQRFATCDLSEAQLRFTDFAGASMKSVNFENSDLSNADMSCCDLREANFKGAKLDNTNFEGSSLEGAEFDEKYRAFSSEGLK